MKVATVLGTRPEIIRLSRVIERLDRLCQHVLIHTGQNFETKLSGIFFDELGVRPPDHYLGAQGDTFGAQVAAILEGSERVLVAEKPDRLLVSLDRGVHPRNAHCVPSSLIRTLRNSTRRGGPL